MSPTLISFYTIDGHYDKHAARIREECERLGVAYCIEPRQDTGSYLGNCRIKPHFIYECLCTHKRPLLWVDVDASVLRNPLELQNLPLYGIDFAARPVTQLDRARKWHVGTMWFNYNGRVLDFVREWCATDGITDEAALHKLERSGGMNALTCANLSPEYFWIGNGSPPPDTVIQHRLSGHKRKKAEYMLAVEDERKNG